MTLRHPIWPVAVLPALLACDGDDIDRTNEGSQNAQQVCSLPSAPALHVGGADGTVWFDRIVQVGWLSDRAVYVVENTLIRLIDVASGGVIGSIGRRGEGPGEFESIGAVSLTDDATGFWIYDRALRRVSRVSLTGSVLETAQLQGDGPVRFPSVRHVMPDGRIVVDGETDETRVSETNGIVESWTALATFGTDLKYERMLWEGVPGSAAHRTAMGSTGRMVQVPVPFGRRLHTAIAGSHLAVGVSDSAMFRMVALNDGEGDSVVRWEEQVRPVETAEHERRVDLLVQAGGRTGRQLARELLMEVPQRGQMPQIGAIKAGRGQEVWVAGYEYLLALPTRWRVFVRGADVSRVHTPADFRVESVRGSWVAGIWRDQFEVEHVQVYRLTCDSAT